MLRKLTVPSGVIPLLVRYPGWIVSVCGLFVLVSLGLVMALLAQGRHDAVLRAVDNAGNLTLIVERDVARTVELFDLSLQAVVDGVKDPGVMRLPSEYRQRLLFDRSATAGSYLGVLLYIDADGEIAIDSANPQPRQGNFADRPWFTVHRDNPRAGLFISPPYRSPLRNNEWSLAFSRRVNRADGSFAGVVVGALQLDYFSDLLAGLKLGPQGRITLYHEDGTIVMRLPDGALQIGRNLKGTPNFERFREQPSRWFVAPATLDAEERLYVSRRFEKTPFLISVAPGKSDIYSGWTRRAWEIGAFSGILAAALMGAAWLLAKELRYRLKIESDLLLLSRTDGLTGLSNRRTLDEALRSEWRRAVRVGKPLSLLFIDIDRFKNFNDRYGHQAGDDALVAVAHAIGGAIRRPGDIAGRFGGEEFLVLLPNVDAAGAELVAAQIQQAIRGLRIGHESSEHGIVTVSIGVVGSDILGPDSDPGRLLQAADRALYAAKAGGRNRIAVAGAASPDGAANAQAAI